MSRVRTVAIAVLGFLASMCASVPQHHTAAIPPIEQLSLDDKVGQLFAVIGHGVFMSESSMAYQELLHHVRDNHAGGVMWSVSPASRWTSPHLTMISGSRLSLPIACAPSMAACR